MCTAQECYEHGFPIIILFFSQVGKKTIIIIIVLAPVGLVGNRGYAAGAADGLKAVGRLGVNSF